MTACEKAPKLIHNWRSAGLAISSTHLRLMPRLRRRWDSNPRMKVLQTSALPLGYVARRDTYYTSQPPLFKRNLGRLITWGPAKGQIFIQRVEGAFFISTLRYISFHGIRCLARQASTDSLPKVTSI